MKERIHFSHASSDDPDVEKFRAETIESWKRELHQNNGQFVELDAAFESQARKMLQQAVDILERFLESKQIMYGKSELLLLRAIPIFAKEKTGAAYVGSSDVILVHPELVWDEDETLRVLVHEIVHALSGYSVRISATAAGATRNLINTGLVTKSIWIEDGELVRSEKLLGFNEGMTDLITRLVIAQHLRDAHAGDLKDVSHSSYRTAVDACSALIAGIAQFREEEAHITFDRWVAKYLARDFLVFKEVKEAYGWRGLELLKAISISDQTQNLLITRYFSPTTPDSDRPELYQEIFPER